MFDLRHHIIAMVGIFLALGLGILIGITMVDDKVLVEEQKSLIDGLEKDFFLLREQAVQSRQEIASYREELGLWQDFSRKIAEHALRDQLLGKRIAIIQTGSTPLPYDLIHNLELAGAEIISYMDVNSFYGDGSRAPNLVWEEALKGLINDIGILVTNPMPEGAEEREKPYENFGEDLYGMDGIIIAGGADAKDDFLVEQIDIPLIKGLKEYGLFIAGVEVQGMKFSYIPYYQKQAHIVVDHIESLPGQVALIWALTGVPGYYGIGTKAIGLLPEMN